MNVYGGIRTFLKLPIASFADYKKYDMVVLGVPYDGSTSFRSGARFGPSAVRDASIMLTDGCCPRARIDPTKVLNIIDGGDVPVSDWKGTIEEVETYISQTKHSCMIGGDHSVTLGALRARHRQYGKMALVHFDAHYDTWEGCEKHGTFVRDAINEGLIDPHHVVQIGIRSPVPTDVADWTKKQGVLTISSLDAARYGVDKIANMINSKTSGLPTYFTFDIDCLDPSFAPGTGTPEIGGLSTREIISIFEEINFDNMISMDLVEVLPAHDNNQITALAGATIIWMYLTRIAVLRKS